MFGIVPVTRSDRVCRRCKLPIAPDSLALGGFTYLELPPEREIIYHPACAIDVSPEGALSALRERSAPTERYDALYQLALTRVVAKTKLLESRREAKRRGTEAKIPTIEPARDPRGRPRVRLYWAGSLSNENGPIAEQLALLAPDNTFASSLREYVLLHFVKVTKKSLDDDPSQPLVGALFGTLASVRLGAAQKDKLTVFRAEGLPTPLLWIVDFSHDQSLVDARVVELRAALDAVGYVGDEASVVVTHSIDTNALETVFRAMDECLGAHEGRDSAADPALRAADRLAQSIEQNETETYAATLEIASRSLRGTHASVKARLAQMAVKCLTHPPARSNALGLLMQLKQLSVSLRKELIVPIEALVVAMLRDTSGTRSYPNELSQAMFVLQVWDHDGRFALLVPAYTAPKLNALRRKILDTLLRECDQTAVLDQLRAWAATLSDSDAVRRTSALALCEAMAVRCDEADKLRAAARAARASKKKPSPASPASEL
jgi:hypothetical protein